MPNKVLIYGSVGKFISGVCVCVCIKYMFKNNILRKILPKLFHEENGCSLWTGQSGTRMGGEATEIIKTKHSLHLIIHFYLKNRNCHE